MIEIEVQAHPKFEILYKLPKDINLIICIGGRAGAKTHEVSKFAAVQATVNKKRIVVLRDEKSLIKESILNEIWLRYDAANENGMLDKMFEKNNNELKDKKTGKTLIYTKGFKASDGQKRANLKGPSDIDIAICEEGEDIRDKDKFYTFIDGLRKQGCIVIFILNTPDINHFIIKQYYNCEATEHDGYFKITPKKIKGFLSIFTTYKDTEQYLPKHIIDRYESYGDPQNTLYDLHYYLTAIKGYASTGRKGQILTNVKPITLSEYMRLPFREFYGQDFGTASPAPLVGVKFDGNNCYCRLIDYAPKSTLEIAKLYSRLKLHPSDRIIADSADAMACSKLKNGFKATELDREDYIKYPEITRGFNVIPVDKPKGSIQDGISLMKSMNLFAVEEHKELWNEIFNYVWDQDKNGNYTDDPTDEYNHCFSGDTLITTDKGKFPIKNIKIGDNVFTSDGFKPVVIKHNNGKKQLIQYRILFDTFSILLWSTRDHKIKTTKGWKQISELKSGMTVYLDSYLMEKFTNCTQKKDIFRVAEKDFMWKYGSFIMDQFKKVIQFIIKMKILGIIKYQILNLSKAINIYQITGKNDLKTTQNGLKNSMKKELKRLKIGIKVKKVYTGTKNMLTNIIGGISHIKDMFAKYAIKNLKPKKNIKNSVPIIVSQSGGETIDLMMKKEYVSNVEKNLQSIGIRKQKVVDVNEIEAKVDECYDLTVAEQHEYFANRLLVHNCIDGWRYVISDQRGKKKLYGY